MNKIKNSLLNKIEALYDKRDSVGALLTPNLSRLEETTEFIIKYSRKYKHKYNRDLHQEMLNIDPKSPVYGLREEITVGKTKLYKIHVIPRYLRHDDKLLKDLGIRNKKAGNQYYEYDPSVNSRIIIYIDEYAYKNYLNSDKEKKPRKATIYEYHEQNPKGEVTSVNLHSKDGVPQGFCITANWAPFCQYHFILFAKNHENLTLKQIYHTGCTLRWIDDLFNQLNNTHYRLFFNEQGAGHSMDTMHFQVLKSPFPVFEHFNQIYPNKKPELILIDEDDWSFRGILARYTLKTKDEVLSEFEKKIKEWVSDPENTLNLLFQVSEDGFREFFFVFRKKGFNYVKGISNGIAGFEVAGNMLIEDRKEYQSFFPDKLEKLELCAEP